MAEIVLGMWTSHGPTLSTTPEQWALRVKADLPRRHPFRGQEYSFDELVEMRKGEDLGAQATIEVMRERHRRCQDAIVAMADRFAAAAPDAAVIFGNDQRELFLEDVTPAITVFTGDRTWDQPATAEQAAQMAPGIHAAEPGHSPPEHREYQAFPELAAHICGSIVPEGFDIAVSKRLPTPSDHWSSGVPHAFGFVYRQIMRDAVIPHVPIILNTFFPPNQPTARRCFELGRAVGRALRSWQGAERIAVFGSGGMSHFTIDEDFDRMFLNAILGRDDKALVRIDDAILQSGTSELKTWIAAAGALFDAPLAGDTIDYVPCYRSAAGTGTANGFVAWG
jgi:OH-DDVA oxygenase/3-O-methylgallate 3,4-dioxygenase